MVARQLFTFDLPASVQIRDDLNAIMANSHLSSYFQSFAREVIVDFITNNCSLYKFVCKA